MERDFKTEFKNNQYDESTYQFVLMICDELDKVRKERDKWEKIAKECRQWIQRHDCFLDNEDTED